MLERKKKKTMEQRIIHQFRCWRVNMNHAFHIEIISFASDQIHWRWTFVRFASIFRHNGSNVIFVFLQWCRWHWFASFLFANKIQNDFEYYIFTIDLSDIVILITLRIDTFVCQKYLFGCKILLRFSRMSFIAL